MLMSPDDVEQWLHGSVVEEALKMQKLAPDDAIVMRPEEMKSAWQRSSMAERITPSFCCRCPT
jgi:hypothetical protein